MLTFRTKIILRICLILILGYAAIYVFTETYFWLVSLWLILFAGIGLYEFIKFLERSKREMSSFLMGIKQKDFSTTYTRKPGSRLDNELNNAFGVITNEFQQLRKEKESNYHFLQAVVEHSGIPLIGYDEESGEISLMNRAAKKLFKRPYLHQISAVEQLSKPLAETIQRLKSGEKELVNLIIENELLNLSVLAKEIKLDERLYKLVSFQNIRAELDEKELESWQKLIRVLTHEIRNSAIPISTLTEVISQMIIDEQGDLRDLGKLENEDLNDLKVGIQTVQKRSKGLVNFVNAYGELARIPHPKFKKLNVLQLVKGIEVLLEPDLLRTGVKFSLSIDAKLSVEADADMIEQVLINLIKNAKEALYQTPSPEIEVIAFRKNDRTVLSIKDNGPGISTEELEQIFIPFYTTKKEGSGIGLSLSRQFMRAHHGNLTVISEVGSGTTFFMTF